MLGSSVFAITLLAALAGPVHLCSVGRFVQSGEYGWRVDDVEANVDSAAQIVRVRAVSADSTARMVTFEPMEWIRGAPQSPRAIVLPGVAVERDDFNRGTVPYLMVRPSGLRGSCFAEEYRLGREYLLLLKEGSARYPVYWWPLGPVNEQLRDENDAWLRWVRDRVAKRSASPRRPS